MDEKKELDEKELKNVTGGANNGGVILVGTAFPSPGIDENDIDASLRPKDKQEGQK